MPEEDFGARFAATGAFVVPTLTVLRGVATGREGEAQMKDPLLGSLLDAEQRMTGTRRIVGVWKRGVRFDLDARRAPGATRPGPPQASASTRRTWHR